MIRLVMVGFLLLGISWTNSFAIPAFARQMGISCYTCHSQNGYPALNRFGRAFKASGYTMMGTQKAISDNKGGEFLSITDTLNLSLNVEVGYAKGYDPSESSKINFPESLSFMIAGRVANNIGVFTEIGYESEDGSDPIFQLSTLVLPIVYELPTFTIGGVVYRTSEFGPSASFDTLATGSKANGQTYKAVAVSSAQSYIIQNSGEEDKAQGLGIYLVNDSGYIVYSTYVPTVGSVSGITPANYASIAYTPIVGDWDLGASLQYWWGEAKRDDLNSSLPKIEEKIDKFALNFQAMGSVANYPVSFFATYAQAKKGTKDANTPNDVSATTGVVEVAPIEQILMVSAGYRVADNGASSNSADNATLLALKYFYKENVQCQFNYVVNENSQKRDEVYFFVRVVF